MAYTEIYPVCHTLSLHDALPILMAFILSGRPLYLSLLKMISKVSDDWWKLCSMHTLDTSGKPNRRSDVALFNSAPSSRSEEHTSELQSLMRISYAVFCLKKKHTRHVKLLYAYTSIKKNNK